MANSFQLKRTSVPGRVPDITNLKTGELALNMADRIMYSNDGDEIYEIGSKITNIDVANNATLNVIVANGSVGAAGQVLVSDGQKVYWGDVTPQFKFINTLIIADGKTARYTIPGGYTPGSMNVYEDGIKVSIDELDDSDGSTIFFKTIPRAGVEIEYCGMKIGIAVTLDRPAEPIKKKRTTTKPKTLNNKNKNHRGK